MQRCRLHFLLKKTCKIFSAVIYLVVLSAIYAHPVLAQGELLAKKLGSTSASYGYYEYLPDNYYQKSKHPVIVFLSGIGEQGNGKSDLDKVLKHGPPKLIRKGEWTGNKPFLIFAPQSSNGFFSPDGLHEFIDFIIKNYRADASRIYLTGLSAGGISTWNYLGVYQDQVAAAIPICGNGKSVAKKSGCNLNNIAIWAFHGDSDPIIDVDGSIIGVGNINACSPSPHAKVTIYPGVAHDAWTRTYDLTGMSGKTDKKYDSFNTNIYDWLLSHSTGAPSPTPPPAANQPPLADAGDDISVSRSTNMVVLNGANSRDNDGKIVSYVWAKTSGPSANLSGANTSQLTVAGLSTGTYNFRLTVRDEDGASSADEMKLVVSADKVASTGTNGLTYKYYEGSWKKLPDFSKEKVVKTGTVINFSLEPRKRNEEFGFLFEGYIKIDKAGRIQVLHIF